jgi:hypothetical protein
MPRLPLASQRQLEPATSANTVNLQELKTLQVRPHRTMCSGAREPAWACFRNEAESVETPAAGARIAGSGRKRSRAWPAWTRTRTPFYGLVIAFGLIAAAAAQDGDEVRRALAGLASNLDLQTTFPVPKKGSTLWSWVVDADVVRVLVWVAVACGAAALAWHLMDILPKGFARQARWGDAGIAGLPAASGTVAAAQDSADDLAAQGRFVEAMHVLLLQSLSEMRKRLDTPFADSLTSREILRRAPVSDVARAALADIIAAVERAYFGDHAVAAADYGLCRARFAALGEALGPGGRR